MKKYIFITLTICSTLLIISCTNDFFHDTGVPQGHYNGTMLDYLKSDSGFDSTVVMIKHAQLEDLFSGKTENKEITFFAPTNYSIRQYILKTLNDSHEQKYYSVQEIPADLCRTLLLSYVFPGKMLMQDFPREIKGTLEGGSIIDNLAGNPVRIFRRTSTINMPDDGPESLLIHSQNTGHMATVVSCNHTNKNGALHAIDYILTEF